ncbi:hypothetical protein CYLTODRAFT_451039 [Cylindrobasidium torrendii FP15055 ss-10]|uniref:Uncharacterized protein n=1 Tax=Cylindrobasidium torrendii FP15055 ss-10 TaxID=1314674 RepID=A0A0D7BL17_9AGAR|nr:hypothetical protein CYLTODRAFT_451039 [Cylindrobasidium torrendii FP15055 ss-10]
MLDTLVAVVAFPALSFYSLKNLKPAVAIGKTGLPECPASPYFMPFTSGALPGLENVVCQIVGMFSLSLEPPAARQLVAYFLATTVPIYMAFLCFESSRHGFRRVGSFTQLVVGMCAQIITIAVTGPWYMLSFVLRNRKQAQVPAPVSRAHAQASAVAVLAGWLVPTILMVHESTMGSPATAFFQIAPIITFIVQTVHQLALTPPGSSAKKGEKTGYPVVVGTYAASFIMASVYHLATLYKLGSWEAISKFFTLGSGYDTPAGGMLFLFVMDLHVSSATFLLGTLWFGKNMAEALALAVWASIGWLVFGPGAAFAGAALWREITFENQRTATGKQPLDKKAA